MLKDHCLTQLVNGLTRFRQNAKENTLDLVIAYSPETLYQLRSVPPLGKSEHITLLFQLNLYTVPQQKGIQKAQQIKETKKQLAKWIGFACRWERPITRSLNYSESS
jgi:hypothetical protein